MSFSYHNYNNPYISQRINPNNVEGSNKTFVEKHNATISNNSSRHSRTDSQDCSETIYSSGVYMTHSYFGNLGSIIRSCVG
jgi:hypothetical protein